MPSHVVLVISEVAKKSGNENSGGTGEKVAGFSLYFQAIFLLI